MKYTVKSEAMLYSNQKQRVIYCLQTCNKYIVLLFLSFFKVKLFRSHWCLYIEDHVCLIFKLQQNFFKKVSKYICSNVDSHGEYLLNSDKTLSRYNKFVQQIKISVNLNSSRRLNLWCLHVVTMCTQVFKWCFIMHWCRILCYNNLLYDRDVDISLIVWSCTDQCRSFYLFYLELL